MKIIFSLSIFLIFINTSLANNCADHSASDPSVPLCPEGAGILSEVYPVRMATVSTEVDGGAVHAGSFVSQLFASQPDKPPAVIISGKNTDCAWAKQIVARRAPASKRALWVSNIQCNPESEWNWQQDFMQGYVNSSGQPVVRFNPEYYNGEGRAVYKGLPERIQKCGFETNEEGRGGTNPYMGGNIEGMPPDFCVIGDNVPEAERSFMCNGAKNIMVAPTGFMKVGHTDEIMKTVHTGGPPPCNFKVLVGSVDLAKELMAAAPQDEDFIPTPTDITSNVCGFETEANLSPGSGGSSTTTTQNFLLQYLMPQSAFADLRVEGPDGRRAPSREVRDRRSGSESSEQGSSEPLKTCTPQKFLRNLERSEEGSRNNEIGAKLDNFAEGVKKTMGSKLPQCGDVVERVPMLFTARQDDDAVSIFPNPTNGVNINGTMIYSDPNNKIFDKYLTDLSRKIGVKKRTVNTAEPHRLNGNLHCSTNLLRYCRPRK